MNAEELRRRLGGFHQGAKDGRRDVAAEIAETGGTGEKTDGSAVPPARRHDRDPLEPSGGTSEEASS